MNDRVATSRASVATQSSYRYIYYIFIPSSTGGGVRSVIRSDG